MTFTKTMEALKYAHEKASAMTASLNASFIRQQVAAVAPAEAQAARSNLIGQISFKLIADSSLASVRTCMRYGKLDDAFFPKEVIVDRKKLDKLHLSSLDAIGPYILATVEIDSDKGSERFKKLLSGGMTPLVELKGTKYAGTRWIPTGVLDHSGSNFSIVMVPRPLANFWDRCGVKCEGNPMTVAKRQRRSFKDGDGFFARPVSSESKPVHFERGDGVMHAVPCTDVTYDVYKTIVGKQVNLLDEPIRVVVGYVHIDGNSIDQMLLRCTDGSHGASPANLNKIFNAHITEPQGDFAKVRVEGSKKLVHYSKGDGIRFTLDTDFGQGKGHIFCRDLAHRALLILDTKKEWKRIAGDIRFVISTDLHRPRQARLDAESVNNFRLAQAGFVSEFGLDFIGGIAKNIGNVAVMDKMFQAFLDDKDVTSTQDAIEGVPENLKKTDWVLTAMAQLSANKFWVNGELVTMDGVDIDGNPEPMNIWRQPRLAKRAFRHLTERIMQINKLRIPVPIDAAVRAYALFDISIMDHKDPQYDGQGFYLSNGVLSAGTGVVFNTVLDEDGQPKIAERTMLSRDKDGFYSLVETGAFINEMVDAEAATWRQPNGWCGEIWRDQLRLIKHSYYAKMSRSPFMFLSVQPLHVIGELAAWLGHLTGISKLNELLNLWGEWVPYVVVINAVLGGGDFDDLHFIAIQERLVAYLRSKEEIDFIKAFPRTEVNLTPAYSAKAVEYNRHNAALDANMAKADNSGTYGTRAYYRLLQLKASGGLISKVTNADLIWTSLLNDGKPLDVAFSGFCCNLEAVVDGEKKTGTDVAGASKASDAVFKAVTEISEYFAKRMPPALRAEPKYTTYKGAIDLELDILNKDFLLLKEAFDKRYQNPANVQVMSYMEAFPVTTEQVEVAKAWRASYNEVRETVMARVNALLNSDSRFEGCSITERERFSIGESVKEGDLQSFNVVAHLYETNKPLLYGAAIAMYNKLLTSPLYIDAVTGLPTDRADALLFADKFNTVLREAMRYAKCVAQFPQAFEMAAQMGTLAPELTIPGLSLVVVNGVEKKGAEEQERFITTAAQGARVLMHHLDEKVDADMQELWAVCPALRNRSMDAVIVYQGGTHFGFIKKEQISLFKTTYGKDAVGTLARSVNSRTGGYNLFSAQIVINAA